MILDPEGYISRLIWPNIQGWSLAFWDASCCEQCVGLWQIIAANFSGVIWLFASSEAIGLISSIYSYSLLLGCSWWIRWTKLRRGMRCSWSNWGWLYCLLWTLMCTPITSRGLAFSKYTTSIAPIHECVFSTSAKTQKRASRLYESPKIIGVTIILVKLLFRFWRSLDACAAAPLTIC